MPDYLRIFADLFGATARRHATPAQASAVEAAADPVPLRPILIAAAVAMAWAGVTCLGGMLAWLAFRDDPPPTAAIASNEAPRRILGPSGQAAADTRDVAASYRSAPGPTDRVTAGPAARETGAAAIDIGSDAASAPVPDISWPVADGGAAPAGEIADGPPAGSPIDVPQPAEIGRSDLPPAQPIKATVDTARDRPASAAAAPAMRAQPRPTARTNHRDALNGKRYAATRPAKDRRYVRTANSLPPRAPWGRSAPVRECDRPGAQFDVGRSGHHGEFCR